MNSTPAPNAVESNDTLAARADERLSEGYKQIVQAGEQLTRLSEQVAKMERDAARPPSAGPPSAGPRPLETHSARAA